MPLQPAILGFPRLGNLRVGYVPAGLTATRRTKVRILLAGVEARVRLGSLSIRNVINNSPDTARLTVDGTPTPIGAQRLRVLLNSDTPQVLFSGAVQTTDLHQEELAGQYVAPCTAIDDTPALNRRRPIATYTLVSATTVAQALVAEFAPGFSAGHVQAGLPPVTITFDGSEETSACVARLAQMIGGYCYVEDFDLHLFTAEGTDAPDPLISGSPTLCLDPPVTVTTDDSQIRTRLLGKGHGEAVPVDVPAGELIVPIADAVMFNPAGGRAIAGTTVERAQSQRLTYTGVQLGGPGSLVGPGASPSTAPVGTLQAGTGLATATYQYAVTNVTPTGESLPSPVATIAVGLVDGPPLPLMAGVPTIGGGVDAGVHEYAVSFLTAFGETLRGPVSVPVTSGPTAFTDPVTSGFTGTSAIGGFMTDAMWYGYAVSYTDGSGGETFAARTNAVFLTPGNARLQLAGLPISPNPGTAARKIYRTGASASSAAALAAPLKFVTTIADNVTTSIFDGLADGGLGVAPPTTNDALYVTGVIPLWAIPVGGLSVTGRNLYRTEVGGAVLKYLATIADNTTTTFSDSAPDASLGAAAPLTNTAGGGVNQVGLTGIALGASPTTGRKLYRTVAGGSQLKLLGTVADNTTTAATDNNPDAWLGANAPTADTSGLTQPSGQVLAGSTSILLASAGPFPSAGWAIAAGDQLLRYTGITGNTLTGIPAAGSGALRTTVLYGSPLLPGPALTGVTGLLLPMQKGALVHLWVQRDDLAAQAVRAAIDGGDGVYEYLISDERRSEASLIALCDANLALFARPIVTVKYDTRDVKTKAGKPVHIDLASPPIGPMDLVIQDVTITEIDLADGLAPRFSVVASSVRFSLEDLLRQMASALGA